MNKTFNWIVALAPLRHKITVRKIQMRSMAARRRLRLLLLPPALTREV